MAASFRNYKNPDIEIKSTNHSYVATTENPDIVSKSIISSNYGNLISTREITFLTKMQSCEYVPKITDIGGEYFPNIIYMERYDGDLRKFIIGAIHVKEILYSIVRALHMAHSQNIVHRDLKPDNILYRKRSDKTQFAVCDWGNARYVGSKDRNDYTNVCQTLWYRAPEQLLGKTKYGCEIDIWSLGLMAMYILNNIDFISGYNSIDQLLRYFQLCGTPDEYHDSFPVWSDQRYKYITVSDPKLKDLIWNMLEFDPTKRFTINQVLEHEYFNETIPPIIFKSKLNRYPHSKSRKIKEDILASCRSDYHPRVFFLAAFYVDEIFNSSQTFDDTAICDTALYLASLLEASQKQTPIFANEIIRHIFKILKNDVSPITEYTILDSMKLELPSEIYIEKLCKYVIEAETKYNMRDVVNDIVFNTTEIYDVTSKFAYPIPNMIHCDIDGKCFSIQYSSYRRLVYKDEHYSYRWITIPKSLMLKLSNTRPLTSEDLKILDLTFDTSINWEDMPGLSLYPWILVQRVKLN